MSNTLTDLFPDMYEALDVVSRELVGFVPAVARSSKAARAAIGQTVRVPITAAQTPYNITPAATGPNPSAQTVANRQIAITKSKANGFYWEGEEEMGMKSGGEFESTLAGQFAQAMRSLVNEIETDIASLYYLASRAVGTAGTVPFGSDISDAAKVLKELQDNGAPLTDLHLVVGTDAGLNLRSLTQLTNANQAGSDETLRRGLLLDLFGIMVGESAGIQAHTPGTGAGYLVNNVAGLALGDTQVDVDTGAGTILVGDILNFAADTAKGYVVDTALAAGVTHIQDPGIIGTVIPDNNAITLSAAYRAHMGFSRNAIALATRAPAIPDGGDDADDRTVIQDPKSGLAFDVALYRQYHRVAFEVGIAWGYQMIKPEHCVLLQG